jgi:diguanylate cyclase (GGDEF)-like protein
MSVPSNATQDKVVLHVEDSDDFASLVHALLEASNFSVHRTSTLQEGERAAAGGTFACAFVDLDLPDAGGLEAIIAMRAASPSLPLVVLSGQDSATAPVKAILLGAQDWVGKHEVNTDRLSQAATLAIARQDVQAQTAWRAAHDEVTGLPNRALALEHLVRALARASRRSHNVAVYFCDLDRFKDFNDEFGHATGDAVLGAVAHRLIGAMRPGDVVARWGGDEFVIIAEGVDSDAHAITVGTRICDAVSQPIATPDAEHHTSVTIGVATTPGTIGAHDLIDLADQALLKAKSLGLGLYLSEELSP